MGLFAMVRFLTLALFINVVSKVHAIEFSACANNSACNFLVTSDTNNVPAYEILFDFWIYDTNVSGSSEHEKGIFVLQEAQNNIGNPEPIFTAGIKQGNANTLKVGAFDSVMDSSLAVPKNEWIHIGISWKSSTGKLEAVVNGKHWERKLNAGLNRVLSSGGQLFLGKSGSASPFSGSIEAAFCHLSLTMLFLNWAPGAETPGAPGLDLLGVPFPAFNLGNVAAGDFNNVTTFLCPNSAA